MKFFVKGTKKGGGHSGIFFCGGGGGARLQEGERGWVMHGSPYRGYACRVSRPATHHNVLHHKHHQGRDDKD